MNETRVRIYLDTSAGKGGAWGAYVHEPSGAGQRGWFVQGTEMRMQLMRASSA